MGKVRSLKICSGHEHGPAGKIRRGGGSVDRLVCIVLKSGLFPPEHKWGGLYGTATGMVAPSKEQCGPLLLQAPGYCVASIDLSTRNRQ